MSVDDDARQPAAGAPYMSYRSFQNYLTRFAEEGLPDRFDGTYFGNASGSLVAQVRGTLRYLDLMDEDKAPTDLLRSIAACDEGTRRQYIDAIFREKYADALVLPENATVGQLADVFRERGLSGETVQKAITFFLGMAEDLDVTLSPHFKRGRLGLGNSSPRKRRQVKALPVAPTRHAVDHRPTSVDEQKAAYVAMLMELAKGDTAEAGTQGDLLNRIEKALGIGLPADGGADNPSLP